MATAAALVPRTKFSDAIDALTLHLRSSAAASGKSELLAADDFLYLVLTLRRMPTANRLNPKLIAIPHPLFSDNNSGDGATPSVCLFVDDRRTSPSPAEILAKSRALELPVDEAIGLSALRTDYRPYEACRRLCESHDLFLADRTILPLLPRLIGKEFFKKKKIPVAVDLSRIGWPEQIKRCLNSVPMFIRSGTCLVIRIGRVSMELEEVVDNAVAVLEGAIQYVPKKWENLRSVLVKAVESVALPVYQAVPEMGMKIEVASDAAKKRKKEVLEVENVADDGLQKKKKKKGQDELPKRKKLRGRIHDLLEKEFKVNEGEVEKSDDSNEDEVGNDIENVVEEELSKIKNRINVGSKKVTGKKEKREKKVKKGINVEDYDVARVVDDEEVNDDEDVVHEEVPKVKKQKKKVMQSDSEVAVKKVKKPDRLLQSDDGAKKKTKVKTKKIKN